MGFFNNLLNPSAGYNAAQDQLDKYYQQGQAALSPYAKFGQTAGNNLQTAGNALMDPAALRQSWMNSYSMSPEAHQQMLDANNQGLGAASSMGLMGSSSALQAIQSGDANIGMQDKQNFLNDLMQKYHTGINTNMGLFQGGENAASNQANMAQNMGQNSANMAYGSASAPGKMFGDLLKFGAAAAIGGPAGAFGALTSVSNNNMPTSWGGGSGMLKLPPPAQTM